MKNKLILSINGVFITAIFILNYFYQARDFDFLLKCICSSLFALLGIINLIYATKTKAPDRRFYIGMAAGLILAFLGDYLIGYSFIFGAAAFAVCHIFFIIAYSFIRKIHKSDVAYGGILFLGCLMFLLFFPMLKFQSEVIKAVCIVYALIISAMLGKATANFIHEKNAVNGIIAAASILFFFSDLMLVIDKFTEASAWAGHACMGTYYPALCLLAFSMCVKVVPEEK